MSKHNRKIKVALVTLCGVIVIAGSNIVTKVYTVRATNGDALRTAEEAKRISIEILADDLKEQRTRNDGQDTAITDLKIGHAVLKNEVQHIKKTTDETKTDVKKILEKL